MTPITDLSPKVVSVARAIDRLPPGEYSINIIKPESKYESWQIEIDEVKQVQSLTIPSSKMIVDHSNNMADARGAQL